MGKHVDQFIETLGDVRYMTIDKKKLFASNLELSRRLTELLVDWTEKLFDLEDDGEPISLNSSLQLIVDIIELLREFEDDTSVCDK